jgi:hypothetical protein
MVAGRIQTINIWWCSWYKWCFSQLHRSLEEARRRSEAKRCLGSQHFCFHRAGKSLTSLTFRNKALSNITDPSEHNASENAQQNRKRHPYTPYDQAELDYISRWKYKIKQMAIAAISKRTWWRKKMDKKVDSDSSNPILTSFLQALDSRQDTI